MAYDKYTWQTGEVITQEKLNHMEDGIENAYELPAVTETDNGKVLGVENGQFGLVNGCLSSDGFPFIARKTLIKDHMDDAKFGTYKQTVDSADKYLAYLVIAEDAYLANKDMCTYTTTNANISYSTQVGIAKSQALMWFEEQTIGNAGGVLFKNETINGIPCIVCMHTRPLNTCGDTPEEAIEIFIEDTFGSGYTKYNPVSFNVISFKLKDALNLTT